jgi:flagellar motor switch protein FliG
MSPHEPKGGIEAVVEMLNAMEEPERQKLMANLAKQDPKLVAEIEQRLFRFEDLMHVDELGMQALLRESKPEVLVVAMRNAPPALKEWIYKNMSQRMSKELQEQLSAQKLRRLSDVQAAQSAIVKLAKNLEAQGKLSWKKRR